MTVLSMYCRRHLYLNAKNGNVGITAPFGFYLHVFTPEGKRLTVIPCLMREYTDDNFNFGEVWQRIGKI